MGGPAWLPGEFRPRGDAEIMPKAVRYDEFGGIEVLRVGEVERPAAGDGQVLVPVKAAGINSSEAVIRTGAVAELFPSTFPSGQEQQSQLDAILRQGGLDTAADVASVRAAFNALMAQVPVPADVQQKPVEIGGVGGIEVTIAGNESERVILYFHGGVYVIGSAATSVPLAGDLVRRTGVNAIRF